VRRKQSIEIGSRLALPNVPVERIGRNRIHVRVILEHAEDRERDAEGFGSPRRVEHDQRLIQAHSSRMLMRRYGSCCRISGAGHR
jgi:hypothetical protein